MVKHVDVVVDSDGAEVVLELEVPVLEDGGVAETPEIIANMNNDKPKKRIKERHILTISFPSLTLTATFSCRAK